MEKQYLRGNSKINHVKTIHYIDAATDSLTYTIMRRQSYTEAILSTTNQTWHRITKDYQQSLVRNSLVLRIQLSVSSIFNLE